MVERLHLHLELLTLSPKSKEFVDEAASSNRAPPKPQIDMKEIFKSRIIRFIVGPEREQFTAHESSIADLSAPLRVLVTGNMKESIEATVIWDDIDPALFVSLMEFAYTGSFSVAKSEQQENCDGLKAPDLAEESCANKRDDERDDDRDDGRDDERDEDERHIDDGDPGKLVNGLPIGWNITLMTQMEEHSASGKFSQKHFRLKQFHQLKDDPSSLNVDMIPYNVKAYMMTAKLYVLADNYDIAALKNLCLFRFIYSLAYISGNDMTMDILVATMRYVYENTIQKDQLRKLLLRFLITDMQWVLSDKGMRKMLNDIPELASQMILLVPSYYWDELHWGRPSTSCQATMTS